MRECSVSSLPAGAVFRVELGAGHHLDYRLLYANQCRAYVEPVGRPRREIKNGEGDVVAEVEDRGGRTNISPGTIVVRLEDVPMSQKTEGVARRGGDRHFAPGPQTRPVRPNTTRAKMLAMLLDDPTGETDIKDVMLAFDMDRNLVVAHIHEMHKCHGHGYSIIGDVISIVNPLIDDAEDLL